MCAPHSVGGVVCCVLNISTGVAVIYINSDIGDKYDLYQMEGEILC